MFKIETERLVLREWKELDLEPFSSMNADPEVMRYFPAVLSKQESDDFAKEIQKRIDDQGYGLWAVELKSSSEFIGFVGLNSPKVNLPFNPCVEIGWRLTKAAWGNGYATEAAKACLAFAFDTLSLNEVLSFTSILNKPSVSVMKRLGMHNTKNNFQHPSVPDGNPLKEHVLFSICNEDWHSHRLRKPKV